MGDTCASCRPGCERRACATAIPSYGESTARSRRRSAPRAHAAPSAADSSSSARTHETTNDKQHTRAGLTPAGNTSARTYGLRPVPNRDRPYTRIRVGGGVEAREGACKLQSPLALLPSLPISLRTTRTDHTTCALRWNEERSRATKNRDAPPARPLVASARAPLPVVAAAAGPAPPGPHHVARA